MIGVLDTSFALNMERAGALALLPAFRARLGWGFVVPEGVLEELAVKRAPPELAGFLADGTARVGRRGAPRGIRAGALPASLGPGESEAIRVVDGCEDRTFSGYAILMDDRGARAAAAALGMGSLDTMDFLLRANGEGLLPAGGAMAALGALEASGWRAGAGARGRFMRSLG